MAINTSNDKVRIISTAVSGLATNSKFSDINSPAIVVNTSDGGIFYANGSGGTSLKQLAALPNHTHSNYVTTDTLDSFEKIYTFRTHNTYKKLGTINLPQNGNSIKIQLITGSGYNGSQSQEIYQTIILRSSNGTANSNGHYVAGHNYVYSDNNYYDIYIIQLSSTEFEIWTGLITYSGDSMIKVSCSEYVSFEYSSTTSSTAPDYTFVLPVKILSYNGHTHSQYSTTDTKNTTGTTNSTSKLFLAGATSQAANPQTYSNASCYTSGGYLYSGGTKVSVEGHTHSYLSSQTWRPIKINNSQKLANTSNTALDISAGSNISLSWDATNNRVTIAATDTKYTHPASISGTTTVDSSAIAQAAPAHGGTFNVVTSALRDASGHISKIITQSIKLPADNNTDTKVKNTASTNKAFILGHSSQATTAEAITNASCYISGGYLYSAATKVSVEGHGHDASDISNVVTGIKLNGSTKAPSSGIVDLGDCAYPVVNNGTSNTTMQLVPNKMYIWDTVTSLSITLAAGSSTYVNEYVFQFTSGETATTLSLPASIKWQNGNQLTPATNTTYQISIINDLAVAAAFV